MPCIAHKFIYALCLCAYKLQREWKREWNRLTDRYFRARVYRIHTYIHTHTHTTYVFVRVIILSEVQSDRASLHPFYMDDSGLLRKTHTHTYDLRCMSLLSRQDATIRPVLKHGPRSSTGLRVVEFLTRLLHTLFTYTAKRKQSMCHVEFFTLPLQHKLIMYMRRAFGPYVYLMFHYARINHAKEQFSWDPKDGELCSDMVKSGEILMEACVVRNWRANRCRQTWV